jgi:hypothetical protein
MLIHSVAFPVLPVGLGTASGLRRPAAANLLLCSRTVPVLAPPFRSPQEKQLLAWGAAPTRFPVPETSGQNWRNVCTSTESPLSVYRNGASKPSPIREPRAGSQRRRSRSRDWKCVVRKLGSPEYSTKERATTRSHPRVRLSCDLTEQTESPTNLPRSLSRNVGVMSP